MPDRAKFDRIVADYLAAHDLPYCPLCGNVNRADLGPVTGMCLDGRACRRRQAGVEPVNPDGGTDA